MRQQLRRLLRLISILVFLPLLLYGQGWQRTYGGGRAFSLQLFPDGSMVIAGNAVDTGGLSNWYWLHADALGGVLAAQTFGNPLDEESAQLLLPGADGWRLFGNRNDSIVRVALSFQGLPQDFTTIGPGTLYGGSAASDGALLLYGSTEASRSLCMKSDAGGQAVWSRTDSLGLYAIGRDAAHLNGGKAWLLGEYLRPGTAPQTDLFLMKLDAAGQLLETKLYEWPDEETPSRMVQQGPNRWVIVGSVRNPENPAYQDEDLMAVAINAAGDTLWRKYYPMPGYQQAHAAKVLPNGHLVLAGETRLSFAGSRDAFLAVLDYDGNLLWFRTYGGIRGDIFRDVQVLPDGGFAVAGQTASFEDATLKAWLVRTDPEGVVWSSRLTGKLTCDLIQNCQPDAGEAPLANWLVTASGTAGTVYALTNEAGMYDMVLDTGAWVVSVLPPVGYWNLCMDSVPVFLEYSGEELTLDFSAQAGQHCPLMQVDVTTPFLRRCFENTYTVRYQNYGTELAENARIAVVPDAYLTPVGSNLPYTMAGDTLLFDIGEVAPFEGGSFIFTARLECEGTVLGQSHCTEAFILPDTLCYAIDPQWDGAALEVSGYCAGDSVVMQVANTGAAMATPVGYIITEDQVIFRDAWLLLGAGQDTTFVLYPGGATVTLVVEQSAGFPGNSAPTLVIEGCGDFPFSAGYAFQFPTDDGDPFHDIECRPNIGSFDPNDKTAMPLGVGEQGYVAAGSAIEYLIRFQNTGTDTAFRVEIRDTLPPGLDLATLEPGGSSPACRMDVSGQGVLRFLFDPVALPDSTTDPAGSQGFVKYRIATRPELQTGTRIENRAVIYFDFNAPVLTAPTLHTIGDPGSHLVVATLEVESQEKAAPLLKVSPNPFHESVRLEWPEGRGGAPYRVEVWDTRGRLLHEAWSEAAHYFLQGNNMKENILMIRVSQQGKTVATGKVLRH